MSGYSPSSISARLFIVVVLLDVAYIVNCLSPYLGVKFENSQAMYSQLDARARNHLVMPSRPRHGGDDYVRHVELEVPAELEEAVAGLRWFLGTANQSGRSLHLQFLDHHFRRLCELRPTAPVRLSYTTEDGGVTRHDDVCSEPELRDPSPIGLFPACDPECYGELEVWASGLWRAADLKETAP